MSTIIIDNYDSFTFNLYQMLGELVQGSIDVFRNDEISLSRLKSLNPSRIVLSPGPGHPAIDRDFGVCKEVIQQTDELSCPVLGICLGHQGIVQHLGGKVIKAPQVVHGKKSDITLTAQSPLFHNLPDHFLAMRYHSLVASEENFPRDLKITARESEHNLIMALEHNRYPLYGLQFHPESIGTPVGQQLLRNFVEIC